MPRSILIKVVIPLTPSNTPISANPVEVVSNVSIMKVPTFLIAPGDNNASVIFAFIENDPGDENFGDPCHEWEHSICFFVILSVFLVFTLIYLFLLYTRRLFLGGFDILCILILFVSWTRFGPKIWSALQIHGVRHVSQTACKLVAFTEFGLRHVNTAWIVGILIFYHLSESHESGLIDNKVKKLFPWLLLFLFALEGMTGMVPAIVTDVNAKGTKCDFARSDELSLAQFLTLQLTLSTVLPYIVPFLAMVYPLYVKTMDFAAKPGDELTQPWRKAILILIWSHITLSLPWSLHALVMLPVLQTSVGEGDSPVVCVLDGIFRILMEMWYPLIPITLVLTDPCFKDHIPGLSYLQSLCQTLAQVKRLVA